MKVNLMITILALLGITSIITYSLFAGTTNTNTTAPTDKPAVVLLHGLARSANSLREMEQKLQAEGYHVINHDYDSRAASIDVLTQQIFDQLKPQIKNAPTVHFVTHSMGGIIAWNYLQTNKLENLGRVVMLAPPCQGSEIPDKLGGNQFFRWIHGPAGDQLGTGTNSLPLQLKPPAFELGIIAGDRTANPFLSMLIPGPDDGKVSVERSKTKGMTDYICLHTTHTFMMRNNDVIDQTKHFLKNGVFGHQSPGGALSSVPTESPVTPP